MPKSNKLDVSLYSKDLPKDESGLFSLDEFALLDIDEGIKINRTEKNLVQLLNMMIHDSLVMKDVEKMKIAHEAGDWNRVQELAHKIKSGAIYIGTLRMKMACQYLERYWKTGQRDALEKLYQQALAVIDETHQVVRSWLEQHGP